MSTATIRTTCRFETENTTATTVSITSLTMGAQRGTRPADEMAVPCRAADPDLWFAETPGELEQAKALCADCPIRRTCLSAALDRAEPWGVWGGEILDQGVVIARKRPRGRPRKNRADQQVA
ncbi:Transcriptional regulator WhiB [Rhodococcus sp. B10]|uniref:Transcriptional regulator WhiB n=2 Tax=Mycobacteriales TaxID=85007 RepID=A0A177YM44_9NOCA|nr:Transcriptional regulator WhiB [Rhodococcus sp. B10]OAK56672.1 transcription factor WhiB [Rhodococcus kyotonensis]